MRPLKAEEIEVRIGSIGQNKNGGYVTMLLYKDARVDRQMLDEEFGRMNWQDKYRRDEKGILFCSIGVYDPDKKEWIWKEDCGTESNTEKEKGEASDAFKRAGFRWNIGVELYDSPLIYLPAGVKPKQNGYGYELANKSDFFGVYVSYVNIDKENNKIVELEISQKGNVIWSNVKRRK